MGDTRVYTQGGIHTMGGIPGYVHHCYTPWVYPGMYTTVIHPGYTTLGERTMRNILSFSHGYSLLFPVYSLLLSLLFLVIPGFFSPSFLVYSLVIPLFSISLGYSLVIPGYSLFFLSWFIPCYSFSPGLFLLFLSPRLFPGVIPGYFLLFLGYSWVLFPVYSLFYLRFMPRVLFPVYSCYSCYSRL